MKHAIFWVITVGLAFWHSQQPGVSFYAFCVLAGMGLRLVIDGIDDWRRR